MGRDVACNVSTISLTRRSPAIADALSNSLGQGGEVGVIVFPRQNLTGLAQGVAFGVVGRAGS